MSSVGEGPKHTVLKQEGFEVASTTHSALEAEIASLRARLDTAKHSLLASSAARTHVALSGRGRDGTGVHTRKSVLRNGRALRPIRHLVASSAGAGDPSKPLKSYTSVARDNAAWHRHNKGSVWNPKDQAAYSKAVAHAQIAEQGTHEAYEPLRLQEGYLHSSEEEEAFENQLISLVKVLEPTYLSEAVQWAQSGSTKENSVLKPIMGALEAPLIKDLDMEARSRVERSVEAIAMKHKLTLPEKEQLRAHLMAPLLMRIRAKVHAQVSHYVTKMARETVLKATNSSTPEGQAYIAAMGSSVGMASLPSLSEGDRSFTNAMHDLDRVYKAGVVNKVDYETQKAKLLSDWLKHSVNKAGGNADAVLRIVLGGDVRGVTNTGIAKTQSEVDVRKKLEMEKGIADLSAERRATMTRDLVYELVHGKHQWGSVTGCSGKWQTPECEKKWHDIQDNIEKAQQEAHGMGVDDAAHWGEDYSDGEKKEETLSEGTAALYRHLVGSRKASAKTLLKRKIIHKQRKLSSK